MNNILSVSASEGLYNCRIKLYPTVDGNWVPVEKMVVERPVFNPLNLEKKGSEKYVKLCEDEGFSPSDREDPDPENILRACRRARSRLYDIIRCNLDFRYFCTFTFNAEIVDRTDYRSVVRKFSQWSDNRVRRIGLKYVGVPEYHKDHRGIHFHVITNEVLGLVDSGTVSVPQKKKPIRITTADKYGVPLSDRKTVYNIPEWGYGFSTAIEITADEGLVRVSQYLKKYLTKDAEKVGGRWYYSGGDLVRPRFQYCHDDFYNTECSYEFAVPGNCYRVLLL